MGWRETCSIGWRRRSSTTIIATRHYSQESPSLDVFSMTMYSIIHGVTESRSTVRGRELCNRPRGPYGRKCPATNNNVLTPTTCRFQSGIWFQLSAAGRQLQTVFQGGSTRARHLHESPGTLLTGASAFVRQLRTLSYVLVRRRSDGRLLLYLYMVMFPVKSTVVHITIVLKTFFDDVLNKKKKHFDETDDLHDSKTYSLCRHNYSFGNFF